MHVINVRNVNEALSAGLWWLKVTGIREESRNGPVLVAPSPVTTVYAKPCERVLFSQLRDANPFFHLFESLWMLGGRNDVAFPARYAAQIATYSDDEVTFHSAYGHRWREHFGFDQLDKLIDELIRDPKTRRAVLSMWDANVDLNPPQTGMKDLPCNTACYFDLRGDHLNMTVVNRSNDVIWGAYGANAVHFSMLMEYMARRIDTTVGVMTQMSNNYHIYIEREDTRRLIAPVDKSDPARSGDDRFNVVYQVDDRYSNGMGAGPFKSVLEDCETGAWHDDLYQFLHMPLTGIDDYNTEAFRGTVGPLAHAHHHYKSGDAKAAIHMASNADALDWAVACSEWLQRRPSMKKALGQA